ncbi:MAG: HAMP domain-containing histidine kinase [Patescibacteria group bacterium]|nr:HAMP domain-containing histidine kinase [Patescibacteria group bacterium]
MLISILFSGVIYAVMNQEYQNVARLQALRQQREVVRQFGLSPDAITIIPNQPTIDPEVLSDAQNELRVVLLVINLGILWVAGVAGYFLAGRTLKPIQEMVNEQNRFVTDASHELRTPITSLKTAIEVYLRGREHNSKEADQLLESNLEDVNNLQQLSDNLIKLSQYQKINGNLTKEETEITDVLEEAVKKVSKLAKAKSIKILTNLQKGKIFVEKTSLIEVVVILLDNAIKYSSSNTQIQLTNSFTEHQAMIEVADQGSGIDVKDIPHLFERFYRADKSRSKNETSGYGLGLAIAKQVIDRHKGSIKVSSKINQGTTFSIILPLQ